ncbi:MAG: pirin-like C-terminal cupin domain-containing protein [Pseudomonadota bacterium]
MLNQSLIEGSIPRPGISEPVPGEVLSIGTGFNALSFKHSQFGGLMDPLVMVDHFTMTEPTFGTHPHAGMSAVSILFEDSIGAFRNLDSLGNKIDLEPGDLYWLKAARGAVHNEANTPGSRTHALQVFVNLPASMKHDEPASLHVRASDVPVIRGNGHTARVVMGRSNGVSGAVSPALPLTVLDIRFDENGTFSHQLRQGQSAWVYALRGELLFETDDTTRTIPEGSAIASHSASNVSLRSKNGGHAVILSGEPIREHFVQKGPFVMSTTADLERVADAYKDGLLGTID